MKNPLRSSPGWRHPVEVAVMIPYFAPEAAMPIISCARVRRQEGGPAIQPEWTRPERKSLAGPGIALSAHPIPSTNRKVDDQDD